MRIGLYGASSNLGGTEVYMINMVREMQHEIIFDYIVGHDCKHIPFEDEILSLGGKIFREYYFRRERHLKGYISPRELIDRHPEWDGIYINVQRIHTAYSLLVEAKRKNFKYRIIHAHSNNYSSPSTLKDKMYEFYFHTTKKKCVTDYLACSEMAGKWMFHNSRPIIVVPNAIDFSRFALNEVIRNKIRRQYDFESNEIVIGFCGRIDHPKNVLFLIKIFKVMSENPTYKLLIVGNGNEMGAVQSKIRQYNLADRVVCTGEVSNTYDYYQAMDCFVLPSRYEGFGIVLLEAQAAGLRCYTTANVVPAETNVTGRVTFIPAEASPLEWATAIEKNGFDRISCLDVMEKSAYSLSNLKKTLYGIFDLNYKEEVK